MGALFLGVANPGADLGFFSTYGGVVGKIACEARENFSDHAHFK